MYVRKNLKKLIVTSVVVGGLAFTPEIYFNDFPIASLAYAESQTFTALTTSGFEPARDTPSVVLVAQLAIPWATTLS